MFGSVVAASALGRILMYPQLSHVGCLISICNLIVINCYANIRYSITRLGSNYPTRLINTKKCTCNKDKIISFSLKVLINARITYKLYECTPNKFLC